MGPAEITALLAIVLTFLIVPLLVIVPIVGFGLLPPVLLRKRIEGWTKDRTPWEVWEGLEKGATRGGFQIRPASYLHEEDLSVPWPAEAALEQVARFFSAGWGRKVLGRDAQAVVFSMRFLPWIATDMGWIGVAWAFPNQQGTTVRFRFRTTYMWPVITFFLTLRLRLYVLNRVFYT